MDNRQVFTRLTHTIYILLLYMAWCLLESSEGFGSDNLNSIPHYPSKLFVTVMQILKPGDLLLQPSLSASYLLLLFTDLLSLTSDPYLGGYTLVLRILILKFGIELRGWTVHVMRIALAWMYASPIHPLDMKVVVKKTRTRSPRRKAHGLVVTSFVYFLLQWCSWHRITLCDPVLNQQLPHYESRLLRGREDSLWHSQNPHPCLVSLSRSQQQLLDSTIHRDSECRCCFREDHRRMFIYCYSTDSQRTPWRQTDGESLLLRELGSGFAAATLQTGRINRPRQYSSIAFRTFSPHLSLQIYPLGIHTA